MIRFPLSGLVCLLLFGLSASLVSAEPAVDEEAADVQKTFYAMGYALARRLSLTSLELNEKEKEAVLDGFRTGVDGGDPVVDMQVYGPKIGALGQARLAAAAEREAAASEEFLARARAESGARVTESGLVYREIEAGSGGSPKEMDAVQVHYHGTLRDGTVFDSSLDRGSPAVFPLNRVIPCWTEALQLMKEGGKAQITCPSDIAYGDQGKGDIPPAAALRFDVELIEIQE